MGYFADNIVIALEAVMPLDEARDEKAQNTRMARKTLSDFQKNPDAAVNKYNNNADKVNAALSKKELEDAKKLSDKEVAASTKHLHKIADDGGNIDRYAKDSYDDVGYTDKERNLRHKAQSAVDALDRHERRHGKKSLKEAFDELYEED